MIGSRCLVLALPLACLPEEPNGPYPYRPLVSSGNDSDGSSNSRDMCEILNSSPGPVKSSLPMKTAFNQLAIELHFTTDGQPTIGAAATDGQHDGAAEQQNAHPNASRKGTATYIEIASMVATLPVVNVRQIGANRRRLPNEPRIDRCFCVHVIFCIGTAQALSDHAGQINGTQLTFGETTASPVASRSSRP